MVMVVCQLYCQGERKSLSLCGLVCVCVACICDEQRCGWGSSLKVAGLRTVLQSLRRPGRYRADHLTPPSKGCVRSLSLHHPADTCILGAIVPLCAACVLGINGHLSLLVFAQ